MQTTTGTNYSTFPHSHVPFLCHATRFGLADEKQLSLHKNKKKHSTLDVSHFSIQPTFAREPLPNNIQLNTNFTLAAAQKFNFRSKN
jgi:hypothetical protein